MNNKFRIKQIITMFLAVIALFAIGITAIANDLDELRRRQQAIQDNIRNQNEALDQARAERNYVLAEIIELDMELSKFEDEYFEVREHLDSITLLLNQAEADLEHAEKQHAAHYEILRSRIRFMHENNSLNYIELLLSSNSIADFLNNMEHIGRIVENDNHILTSLASAEERISNHRDEVAYRHAEVTATTLELEGKIYDLNVVLSHRATRIEQLENDEASHQAMLDTLARDSEQIRLTILNEEERRAAAARAVASAPRGSVTPSNAVFAWPVDGPRAVNSPYGWRTHPIRRTREFHTGVDLRAPHGTPILAAETGTVTFSGRMGGYGNTIIIYHGNGLSTLYAHNSRNLVSVGQQVARGERIALAGATGTATGAHLHFEVRINGNHVNPNRYLGI